MKRILAILFTVFLLMSTFSAMAESDTANFVATKLIDLGIVFGRPVDLEPVENNATITPDGEPFFGFISSDKRLVVEFYGSNLKDLDEAEEWAKQNIGEEITKRNVVINGLNAIEYHYTQTDKEGTVAYTNVVFGENEDGKIFEFWEKTFDEERTGLLSSEIYPISLFEDDDSSDNEAEDTPSADTDSKSEDAPSADVAKSASGVCTANKVNVRVEPNQNARPVAQLSKGDEIVVLEVNGEWSKVSCSDGEGYMKTQYIEMK